MLLPVCDSLFVLQPFYVLNLEHQLFVIHFVKYYDLPLMNTIFNNVSER